MFNNNTEMFSGLVSNPERDVGPASLTALCDDLTNQDIEIEELERKIWKDKQRLKQLKEMSKNGSGKRLLKHPEDSTKRMMYQAQDGILKYMSKAMERCKAQGFVYGIVFENGKTVTGSSDNLREWWKDRVRFDRNGPAAILRHQRQINLSTDGSELGGSEGGECTAHKEGSLWLAALNQEKSNVDQSQYNPLAFSGESNANALGASGETDVLFQEAGDYNVEEAYGSHQHVPEVANNFNYVNNKTKFEGLGVLRDSHQMTCPYKTISCYQPTKPLGMPISFMTPYQMEMQQQEQFNLSSTLYRPKAVERGGNNDYLSDHRFGLVDNSSPSTSGMNHNPGLVLPVNFNGNAETVGMENNQQNQEGGLPMPWIE
ncbi:hypothetical protein Bca101_047607 [Brassica carinata]